MKKINLFDKYTTPEEWKNSARERIRKEENKKSYISFLPSLQTVVAVIVICLIVGFVASGGLRGIIDTSDDNSSYSPSVNNGNVGNKPSDSAPNNSSTNDSKQDSSNSDGNVTPDSKDNEGENAQSSRLEDLESMTDDELSLAYKAFTEAINYEETTMGYENFKAQVSVERNCDIIVNCGIENTVCKKPNIINICSYETHLEEYRYGHGALKKDLSVIVIPIEFESAIAIDVTAMNEMYKAYNNAGVGYVYGFNINYPTSVKFYRYGMMPKTVFAVIVIEDIGEYATQNGHPVLDNIFVNSIEGVPFTIEYVVGRFNAQEAEEIFYNPSDLACGCQENCEHLKLKEHEGLAVSISFANIKSPSKE